MSIIRTNWICQFQVGLGLMISGLMAILILASACGGQGSSSLTQQSVTCDLVVGNCLTPNKDLLELRIFNANPLPLVSQALDVGGACNEGSYPTNRIIWTLSGSGVNTSSTTSTEGTCSLGRYQLRIPVPSGIDMSQVYNLTVQLIAYDANGFAVQNDFQAKKSISVSKPAN